MDRSGEHVGGRETSAHSFLKVFLKSIPKGQNRWASDTRKQASVPDWWQLWECLFAVFSGRLLVTAVLQRLDFSRPKLSFRAAQLSEEAACFFSLAFSFCFVGLRRDRRSCALYKYAFVSLSFPTNLAIKRTCVFSWLITVISYKKSTRE